MPGFVTENQLMESMVVEVATDPAPERRHVAGTLLQLTTTPPDDKPVLNILGAKKVSTPMQLQSPPPIVPNLKHAAKTAPQVLHPLQCAWLDTHHMLGCRSLCTCAGWQLGAATCRPPQVRHS